jgi:uncharacterized membrane protein
MQLVGILIAAVVLAVLVALYYYLFDSPNIDDEEEAITDEETDVERAQVLAKHREAIEEEKIDELKNLYSEE